MFKTIGLKIYAFFGVVIAILLSVVGYRGRKIDELEHKERINDTLDEIRQEQQKAKSEVLEDESENIENEVKERANLHRADRIKRL